MDKLSARWGKRQVFYLSNLLLLIAGLGFGILACYVLGDDKLNRLNEFYQVGLSEIGQSTRWSLMQAALNANGQDLLKIGFLGLSIIGIPLIGLFIFAKGFSVGFTTAFIMTKTGAGGFLTGIIGIVIPKIIYLPVLIMVASYAMDGSYHIIKGSHFDLSRFLIHYLSIMAVLGLLMVLAAVTEGFLAVFSVTLSK